MPKVQLQFVERQSARTLHKDGAEIEKKMRPFFEEIYHAYGLAMPSAKQQIARQKPVERLVQVVARERDR